MWSPEDEIACHQKPFISVHFSFSMQNLSPKESKDLIMAGTVIILDVRTKKEYDSRHIPNALNIDCHSPNFKEMLEKLDKNKEYLVHC